MKIYPRPFFLVGFLLSLASLEASVEALLQGNQVILVDHYNDQDGRNQLGGESRGEEGFQGFCTPGFVAGESAFGRTGASLSLDYDVTAAGSFSYFLIELGMADLTGMSYLSFWMKPETGEPQRKLEFVIELHEDTDGDGRYILGKDTAERVSVTSFIRRVNPEGWKKVAVPLSRFRRIRSWDRILEMAFIFENRWRIGRGRLLVDDLLFGSHYPEGFEAREIPMQNRVSSFKIGGRIASSSMRLKRKTSSLALTLTFIDPYLEGVRFEESEDGGNRWRRIQSFYDHSNGGAYEANWELDRRRARRQTLVRAVGLNALGGETELAGPYSIRFV